MFKATLNINKYILHHVKHQIQQSYSRQFFRWLIVIFNGVNQRRIEEVGPDRACAEWLLRNGASVRWKDTKDYLTDYNLLPDKEVKYYIQAVDATDSAIHHVGFPHFSGCKYIEEIKLVRCSYIENEAIPLLSILKDTLNHLEVIDCKNITDEALLQIKDLKGLKTLKLGSFPYVKEKSNIVSQLSSSLPNCKITYED